MTTDNENPLTREQEEVISRRAISKKAAYVVPAVLAVIEASQRPVLAASNPVNNGGRGRGNGNGKQGNNGNGGGNGNGRGRG